ncbi:MAG: aldo/keto reductase [Rhodospirillales bacterium]|nr:aldo/keto reductase [Rhodospirillales bacterium]
MGPVDRKVGVATVRSAIDAGINIVDTAEGYGDSEKVVGEALKGGYRDRCFLATKATHIYSADGITAALENSLKSLQTDVIDLYQVHHWRPQYALQETMETMARLQEQGKVRYIGVSNFVATQLERASAHAPVQSNQLCYNMFQRTDSEETDFPFCRRQGVGVLVHSTLAKGILSGKYDANQRFSPVDDQRSGFAQFQPAQFPAYVEAASELKSIAADCGLSLIQLALSWTLRHAAVTSVLIGAKAPGQITDYLPASGATMEPDILSRIDAILSTVPQIPDDNRKNEA